MSLYVSDMSGRVAEDRPDLASGYYLYTDESVAQLSANGMLNCATRPGFVRIKGIPDGTIPTCNGRVTTEMLPDMHIVNWQYRPFLLIALVATALLLAGLTIRNVMR